MKDSRFFLPAIFNPKDKKKLVGEDKENYFNLQTYDAENPKADSYGYIHFKSVLSLKLWKHLRKVKK